MSEIRIRGARTHNLKNIDIDIPKDRLVVLTGVSGSGKSSLAFDTLYAEGQRRYVESLSSYARQFLELMEKPDVDLIEGLSPAISIEQKGASHNPRSTVGTITEINDYLRLLFARIGVPYCPNHDIPLKALPVSEIADKILLKYQGKRTLLIAPVSKGRNSNVASLLEDLQARGYTRFRIDGEIVTIDELPKLEEGAHTLDIVVDRLRVKEDSRQRIAEGAEAALRLSDGKVIAFDMDDNEEEVFSDRYACPYCGYSVPKLEPKLFSFNSPTGSCPTCNGMGEVDGWDINKVVEFPELSLRSGAVQGWSCTQPYNFTLLQDLSKAKHISLDEPWEKLSPEAQEMVLYGTKDKISLTFCSPKGEKITREQPFEGIIPMSNRRFETTESSAVKADLEKWRSLQTCPACRGARLNEAARSTYIGSGEHKKAIQDISALPLDKAEAYFRTLKLEGASLDIGKKLIDEILFRLKFLIDVGLSYLTLDRRADTLSGGEAQRIRLAGQIGSRLSGVIYVLDEPSIGLHQSDNDKLIHTLKTLRDLGNSVVVVEHDEDTIRAADYVVDMGPAAGVHGGEVIAAGTPKEIEADPNSLTGAYLSGRLKVRQNTERKKPDGRFLEVKGASGHNLKNVDVSVPVGLMTVVTGVSGSGKSTLVNQTIYNIVAHALNRAQTQPCPYKSVSGLQFFDKVIAVDQSPIGRTPRSNPATYTGVLAGIRDLFAETPIARERGYGSGRFSFNVKGGRCEACEGEGLVKVEMNFLPDMYVPCDVCGGTRYNRETLEVEYKGRNIAEVLDLTVDEALEVFSAVPAVARKLRTLADVGLGYIKLGQSATTLSGGEAQRVKLAHELSKRGTGKTLYVLDEPTTGLHFHDVSMLLSVFKKLQDAGNTLLIIEHNLDVIRAADWIIDMGPGGGEDGGTILFEGTPEELIEIPASKTARYLGN